MASQCSTPEKKTSTKKKKGGKGKRGNKNAQPPMNDSIVALAALLEIKRQPTTSTQSPHPSTPSLNPICASATSGDAALHPSPSLQVPILPSSQQQQQASLGHHLWRQQQNLRASPPLTLAAASSAACAGSPSAAATAAAAALMYPPSASSSVAVRAVHHHQQAAMARFLQHPETVRQHAAAVAAAARSVGGAPPPTTAAEVSLGVPRLPPLVGGAIGMQAAAASPQQMTIGRGQLINPVAITPQGLIGLQPQTQAMTHVHAQAEATAPAPSQTQAQAKVQPQPQTQTQTQARAAPQAQPKPKPQRSSPGLPTTQEEEGASSLSPGQPLLKPRVVKSIANHSSEPQAPKNARPALTSPAVVATPEASVASARASPASSLSPKPPSSAAVAVATTATAKTARPPHPPPEELIRPEEVQAALRSKPQRGKKRDNLSLSERMELTRTRNREHAKSTRVRKKARYQELLDREIEWKTLKEEERVAELRRRCVVGFMRLRTANLRRSREQHSGWHCEGEASPASAMTKSSLSPFSNNADETQSPRGQNGHSTAMGTVQAAESDAHDPRGQDCYSTPTRTAQAAEGDLPNVAKCTKGNLTNNDMAETTPENTPSGPSLSTTEATKEGKPSSEGRSGSGSLKDEHDDSHVQFTSLDDCVEDRTRFCFGSLLPQSPSGKDVSKMDGLTALSRHEAACRECVLQQLGAEAADHLSFSVVDSEQGVAIVHDSGFAQLRLTVSIPGGEDGHGGDRIVSAGMMRVTFAPSSHKLRGIELCSYDTGVAVAVGSNNGNPGVVSPGIQSGMMTPVSFPSVVSLENAFHDHVGVTSCDSGQDRYCNTPTKPGSSRQVGFSPEDRNQDGPHGETNGSPDEQHGPGMNYESAQDDVARSDGD